MAKRKPRKHRAPNKADYKLSDWMQVADIPSNRSPGALELIESQIGTESGCYQVALTADIEDIGSSIIHKDIGYTGMSIALFDRTGNIRSEKGKHMVNVYIREHGLCKETEVSIRYIGPTDAMKGDTSFKTLEKRIQDETKKQFGYKLGFKWEEASGGNAGVYLRTRDTIASTFTYEDTIKLLTEMKGMVKDKAIEKAEMDLENLFAVI
jgi:hypothetical protein